MYLSVRLWIESQSNPYYCQVMLPWLLSIKSIILSYMIAIALRTFFGIPYALSTSNILHICQQCQMPCKKLIKIIIADRFFSLMSSVFLRIVSFCDKVERSLQSSGSINGRILFSIILLSNLAEIQVSITSLYNLSLNCGCLSLEAG